MKADPNFIAIKDLKTKFKENYNCVSPQLILKLL